SPAPRNPEESIDRFRLSAGLFGTGTTPTLERSIGRDRSRARRSRRSESVRIAKQLAPEDLEVLAQQRSGMECRAGVVEINLPAVGERTQVELGLRGGGMSRIALLEARVSACPWKATLTTSVLLSP